MVSELSGVQSKHYRASNSSVIVWESVPGAKRLAETWHRSWM